MRPPEDIHEHLVRNLLGNRSCAALCREVEGAEVPYPVVQLDPAEYIAPVVWDTKVPHICEDAKDEALMDIGVARLEEGDMLMRGRHDVREADVGGRELLRDRRRRERGLRRSAVVRLE